jgi:titin
MADGVSQGSITGKGVACGTFPYNPLVPEPRPQPVDAGPHQLIVTFEPGGYPTLPAGTTWEYQLDDGPWKTTGPTQVVSAGGSARKFTVNGLVDGQNYLVHLRATNSNGVSVPVRAYGDTMPFTQAGEPTAVKVETRPSALAISWEPPAAVGTVPVTGYNVFVLRADGTEQDPGPTWECHTDGAARGCVIGVPAGAEYNAFVIAVAGMRGGHPNASDPQVATSGVVPMPAIPAAVPHKDDDLSGQSGPITTVIPGKTVVLKGTGFAPFSKVQAVAYSTPTEMGTYVTDENGSFEITVTIPDGLPAGHHTLVVSGVDASGNRRNVLASVTVDAAGKAVLTKAAVKSLAYTGANIATPLIGGLVSLTAGGALLVATRRRWA